MSLKYTITLKSVGFYNKYLKGPIVLKTISIIYLNFLID